MIEELAADRLSDLVPLCAAVQRLHAEAEPEHFPPEIPADEMLAFFAAALEGGQTVLAWRDGARAVGYLMYAVEELPATPIRFARRQGKLHHVSVLDSHRRQGIGAALVDEMKRRLRADGVERWSVTYWSFNAASAALMARAGARPLYVTAEAPV